MCVAGTPGYSEGILGVLKALPACFPSLKWEAYGPQKAALSQKWPWWDETGKGQLGTSCCGGGYIQYPWQAKGPGIMG